MVIRPGEYIWLFPRVTIYMAIRPGEYIYGYSPGRIYIWLFARANVHDGYSPGRIYIINFKLILFFCTKLVHNGPKFSKC